MEDLVQNMHTFNIISNDEEESKTPYWEKNDVKHFLEEININRWFEYVQILSSYNRYSLLDGINEARDWISSLLKNIEGMDVSCQEFTLRGKTVTNVIGTLKGTDDVYIIGAHYDSISENPEIDAPGAVDNATGTAAVLELANIFSKHRPKATVCFILFAGEEQGFCGSKTHVRNSDTSKIKLMLNIDMIGWDNPDGNMIEIETSKQYVHIADFFAQAAIRFCDVPPIISSHPWGSDHVPFLKKNIPAILTTNYNCTHYKQYHTTGDTCENVSLKISYDILKMAVVTLAVFLFNHHCLDIPSL